MRFNKWKHSLSQDLTQLQDWNLYHFLGTMHGDVIKWKHFPRYWPFVRGIHRSPVNSPHKGRWRGALMFALIWAWINGWINNHEAGNLRLNRGPLWRHSNGTSLAMCCGLFCGLLLVKFTNNLQVHNDTFAWHYGNNMVVTGPKQIKAQLNLYIYILWKTVYCMFVTSFWNLSAELQKWGSQWLNNSTQ